MSHESLRIVISLTGTHGQAEAFVRQLKAAGIQQQIAAAGGGLFITELNESIDEAPAPSAAAAPQVVARGASS
jgi:hypothetical protein